MLENGIENLGYRPKPSFDEFNDVSPDSTLKDVLKAHYESSVFEPNDTTTINGEESDRQSRDVDNDGSIFNEH